MTTKQTRPISKLSRQQLVDEYAKLKIKTDPVLLRMEDLKDEMKKRDGTFTGTLFELTITHSVYRYLDTTALKAYLKVFANKTLDEFYRETPTRRIGRLVPIKEKDSKAA